MLKLPRLESLGASFSDDIVLAPAAGDPNPGTLRGPTAFGDDVPTGRRLCVRARLTPDGNRLHFDYSDSDERTDAQPNIRISVEQVQLATLAGVNRVMDRAADDRETLSRFLVTTQPTSWVGGEAGEPMFAAFGMARVYDAALGAMANAWPSRVGAGSCSLGAIVSLRSGEDEVYEVLEGGEGATPTRAGADNWPCPLSPPCRGSAPWLSTEESTRPDTGGLGARRGGDGMQRVYTVAQAATVTVAIDRVTNPPHGIDRAGPPQPAEFWIRPPNGELQRGTPWIRHELPAGSTVIVKTAGGA
ncbi:MAG: hydantoinase B/oxoprolinase family protein [Nannocystaceae bacterium]|nr:hydantoinase B/oxoprolinase family protein [Nannocystaceae bacterium]